MSEIDQLIYVPRPGRHQRISVSTTAARTQLFTALAKTGWIRVISEGCNTDVNFGDVTVTIPTFGQVSASDGDVNVAYPIKNNTYHDFWITNETYISWDADGVGTLFITRAGRERTGK